MAGRRWTAGDRRAGMAAGFRRSAGADCCLGVKGSTKTRSRPSRLYDPPVDLDGSLALAEELVQRAYPPQRITRHVGQGMDVSGPVTTSCLSRSAMSSGRSQPSGEERSGITSRPSAHDSWRRSRVRGACPILGPSATTSIGRSEVSRCHRSPMSWSSSLRTPTPGTATVEASASAWASGTRSSRSSSSWPSASSVRMSSPGRPRARHTGRASPQDQAVSTPSEVNQQQRTLTTDDQ